MFVLRRRNLVKAKSNLKIYNILPCLIKNTSLHNSKKFEELLMYKKYSENNALYFHGYYNRYREYNKNFEKVYSYKILFST